jgi:hypothetical protein
VKTKQIIIYASGTFITVGLLLAVTVRPFEQVRASTKPLARELSQTYNASTTSVSVSAVDSNRQLAVREKPMGSEVKLLSPIRNAEGNIEAVLCYPVTGGKNWLPGIGTHISTDQGDLPHVSSDFRFYETQTGEKIIDLSGLKPGVVALRCDSSVFLNTKNLDLKPGTKLTLNINRIVVESDGQVDCDKGNARAKNLGIGLVLECDKNMPQAGVIPGVSIKEGSSQGMSMIQQQQAIELITSKEIQDGPFSVTFELETK